MKRKVLLIGALALGLLLLGLGAVAVKADSLVRAGLERMGGDALQVPVQVGGASVRLPARVAITGFTVSNPPGFAEPRAFSLGEIRTDVRLGSLREDVVEVREVTISEPELTLEFVGGRTNLSALMDNLSAGRDPGEEPSEKKFRIAVLRVRGATVRFRADALGREARAFTLRDFELRNLGTAADAATPAQVLSALLRALANEAMDAAQGAVPSEVLQSLRSGIERAARSIQEELQERLRKLTK